MKRIGAYHNTVEKRMLKAYFAKPTNYSYDGNTHARTKKRQTWQIRQYKQNTNIGQNTLKYLTLK